MVSTYTLKPIGVVHSPFEHREDVPPRECQDAIGRIEVFTEYAEGLKDIDGFSHLVVLWIFHESTGYGLLVKSLAHDVGPKGVFATSALVRPTRLE